MKKLLILLPFLFIGGCAVGYGPRHAYIAPAPVMVTPAPVPTVTYTYRHHYHCYYNEYGYRHCY